MGENEKYYIFMSIGLMIVSIVFILCNKGLGNTYLDLYAVLAIMGTAVASKILGNRILKSIKVEVIDLIAMNNIMKMMILLLYTYFRMDIRQQNIQQLQLIRFFLQLSLVDFNQVLILLSMLYRKNGKYISVYETILIIILGTWTCKFIPIEYYEEICNGIYLLNFVVMIPIYFKHNKLIQSEKDIGLIYRKGYLFFCIIQFGILILLIKESSQYFAMVVVCIYLQVLCHLCYTYVSCLKNPWQQKKSKMCQVEEMIDEQGRMCDTIVKLSHELKTPINVIRSALEILDIDYQTSQEVVGKISDISVYYGQVMNMIQNMIDIQRIKGEYITLKYQVYNLVEVIENVVDVFSEYVEEGIFVFDTKEEEIYQEIDLKMIQQSLLLLFQYLLKEEVTSPIYIEIGETEKGICMQIQHDKVKEIKRLDHKIKKLCREYYEENSEAFLVEDLLTVELICLILDLHHVQISYQMQEEKDILEMIFTPSDKVTDKWLDEENKIYLREQIKVRNLIGNAINKAKFVIG